MSNELRVFSYTEAHQIRTTVIGGEPWFVAKDVCGEHRRCEVVSGKASRRCVVMRGRAKNGTKWQALESFGRPYQGMYYECGAVATE